MKEAIANMRAGLNAGLDALVLIEKAYDRDPSFNGGPIQRALVDLADGFRGLAALATTAGGGPELDERRIQRMAEAAARVVFEKRGNHAEAHLSEFDLTGILEATILLALELR